MAAAARLLESDLTFKTTLSSEGRARNGAGELTLICNSGHGPGEYHEAQGTVVINWYVTIDAREWGIKSIDASVSSFVLDGYIDIADEDGDFVPALRRKFHYEYPEAAAPAGTPLDDVDAATPEAIARLSEPKWKVDIRTDSEKDTYFPRATVDLDEHTIEIEF